MTIDERIEKLTERHEALAQSVEILSHNVEALTVGLAALTETVRKNAEDTNHQVLALLALAGLHQKRLDDIQGGSQ